MPQAHTAQRSQNSQSGEKIDIFIRFPFFVPRHLWYNKGRITDIGQRIILFMGVWFSGKTLLSKRRDGGSIPSTPANKKWPIVVFFYLIEIARIEPLAQDETNLID